jgi:hypothetical protein
MALGPLLLAVEAHGRFTTAILSCFGLEALFSTAERLPSGSKKEVLVWFLCRASEESGGITRCIDPFRFRALLEEISLQPCGHENVVRYPEQPEVATSWLKFFDWLGRSDVLSLHPYDAPTNLMPSGAMPGRERTPALLPIWAASVTWLSSCSRPCSSNDSG